MDFTTVYASSDFCVGGQIQSERTILGRVLGYLTLGVVRIRISGLLMCVYPGPDTPKQASTRECHVSLPHSPSFNGGKIRLLSSLLSFSPFLFLDSRVSFLLHSLLFCFPLVFLLASVSKVSRENFHFLELLLIFLSSHVDLIEEIHGRETTKGLIWKFTEEKQQKGDLFSVSHSRFCYFWVDLEIHGRETTKRLLSSFFIAQYGQL